jgi:hypothetical protein
VTYAEHPKTQKLHSALLHGSKRRGGSKKMKESTKWLHALCTAKDVEVIALFTGHQIAQYSSAALIKATNSAVSAATFPVTSSFRGLTKMKATVKRYID